MNIIFPCKPGSTHEEDSCWSKELIAAEEAGFSISLLSDAAWGDPLTIRPMTSFSKEDSFLYRGWILKPQSYKELTEIKLSFINNYDNYMWSYHFPHWYNELKDFTPASLIIEADEISSSGLESIAKKVSNQIGNKSVMIKDYLKSRKHEWYDACFIRDASDEEELVRVMSNFFNLQGRDFYGGLVFRDFLNLKRIGVHSKSRMPLPIEFRTFFVKGLPITTIPYWSNDVEYPENVEFPPAEWLATIGQLIKSPFVALDIAQDEDNKWWVIEVNDGGSAGLPDHTNLEEFYKLLSDNI